MQKITKSALRRRAVAAIKAGQVAFAHPKAAECFPVVIGAEKSKTTRILFRYCHATFFGPSRKRQTKGGMVLQWGGRGIGFGEITISFNAGGQLVVDTECMGPRFTRAALKHWVESVVASVKV